MIENVLNSLKNNTLAKQMNDTDIKSSSSCVGSSKELIK
jgi:hypothetical protein